MGSRHTSRVGRTAEQAERKAKVSVQRHRREIESISGTHFDGGREALEDGHPATTPAACLPKAELCGVLAEPAHGRGRVREEGGGEDGFGALDSRGIADDGKAELEKQ